MHIQVLSSGSKGNSTLVRASETHLLVDAGLPVRALHGRLETARVASSRIDHIALTHGHLDHARSSGAFAKKARARVWCAERLMRSASVRRAPQLAALAIGREQTLAGPRGEEVLHLRAVKIPHDAEPTVAFRLEHDGRVALVITDMGEPRRDVAQALSGAHLILLEFNHDKEMLLRGSYSPALKRRVGGNRGHLSNEEACAMLRWLAGPELHTVVLAHLSEENNTPMIAWEAASHTLDQLGLAHVRVIVADQYEVGPNLKV